MIRQVDDQTLRERATQRAIMLSGSDELHLASAWLDRPEVFCVADENEVHGAHRDPGALSAAIAAFPQARWFLAAVHDGQVFKLFEIEDPLLHLEDGKSGLPLPDDLWALPFLFFAVDDNAALLYSVAYEFRLVSGSKEFVEAYVRGSASHPLSDLRGSFQEAIDWYEQAGNEDAVRSIQQTEAMAFGQVKLPPGMTTFVESQPGSR